MEAVRRAVIDVGTNSVKLLVADVSGCEVRPRLEVSRQTRLGRGFYETHHLQPGPIAETAAAVAEFAGRAHEEGAAAVRVIATSAARDAVNAADLLSAVKLASGLVAEVISGRQEADWAFRGVTSDPRLALEPLLVLDVGGGSTEFILGQGEYTHFRNSYPMGSVRLLEKHRPGDPPRAEELAAVREWLGDFLERRVRPELEPALEQEMPAKPPRTAGSRSHLHLAGSGGTASILGCMEAQLDHFDRQRLEATCLSLDRVQWHTRKLWSLPLEERKRTVGLPPNRADVILMGLAIYEAVMERFEFPELRVTTRGLRFAALMDPV
jgi:exopolyphosphatase / guanosine-5'-triphosphate,3'-diphosphate pyrophosphatase